MINTNEHPFAQYVRILGKGKNTSRSLTREEAAAAFTHILNQEVEDIQLGAFLLLLRVNGEDANEMAGFAEATQRFIDAPPIHVDIDWPSYAGKHKQHPWFLLAALLLASNDHKILMHGSTHITNSRFYAGQILQQLGIPACENWKSIEQELARTSFAYAPLKYLCPPLEALFSFRPLLGVRSPVNSLIKLANPLHATTSLQSVFHPAYLEIHQQAALILGYQHSLVLKGEGGEIEFRPDAENRLFLTNNGLAFVEKWSRIQAERQADLELIQHSDIVQSGNTLKDVWSGLRIDDYALNAILGTTAMVLFARGLAANAPEAWSIARDYWHYRDKNYVGK